MFIMFPLHTDCQNGWVLRGSRAADILLQKCVQIPQAVLEAFLLSDSLWFKTFWTCSSLLLILHVLGSTDEDVHFGDFNRTAFEQTCFLSATKEAMDWAHPPQSSRSLHLGVKTCQRPSCELPLVSGIDTPDQATKPSSFLCSSSSSLSLFSLGTSPEVLLALLSPVTSQEVLSPSCLLWDSGTSPEVLSCSLQDAPELPPELSPEVPSSRDLPLNFCCWELQTAAPANKRTSSYSSNC